MTTDHDKSLSRMSVEMTEDAASKVVDDNTDRIHVTAIEESKIRKAVGSDHFLV